MKSKILALGVAFTLMLTGCGPKDSTVKAESVSLDKTSATLVVGDHLQLTATVLPENATDKTVTWSASDTSIVSVENGYVTALKAGDSTVTATTVSGGFKATCTIKVNNPVVHVESVSLDKTTATMVVGDELTLTPTVLPANATDKAVRWSVTGDAVTVANGKVTAEKAGEATVKVTTVDGAKEASCVITVNNPVVHVTSVSLDKTEATLVVGDELTLTPTVLPDNADDKSVSWSVTGTAATVDNGKVTAANVGESTVTVTTTDGSKTASCVVTVIADSYPEGTFMATIATYKLVIAIGNETNKLVAVRVSTADAVPTGITYDKITHKFEITTTGSVGGYTLGKITGEYDVENDKLIKVNCDGTLSVAVADAELSHPTNLYYQMNGNTEALQGAFKRRYRPKGAGWSVDSNNTDRFLSETTTKVAGAGAMSVRPCGNSFDAYGFTLGEDLIAATTAANIHFWVYNPCDYDIVFRGYYYKATGFNSNGQIGFGSADVAKANSWTYVSRGFTSSAIYNFTVTVWTSDQTQSATTMSARLVFDDVLLY